MIDVMMEGRKPGYRYQINRNAVRVTTGMLKAIDDVESSCSDWYPIFNKNNNSTEDNKRLHQLNVMMGSVCSRDVLHRGHVFVDVGCMCGDGYGYVYMTSGLGLGLCLYLWCWRCLWLC